MQKTCKLETLENCSKPTSADERIPKNQSPENFISVRYSGLQQNLNKLSRSNFLHGTAGQNTLQNLESNI